MISIGMDVGKRAHEACFLGADGREVSRSLRFSSGVGGVQHFLNTLQALE